MSPTNVDVIRSSVEAFNKSQGQLKAIAPTVHDPTFLERVAARKEPFTKMSCNITAIESQGDQVHFTYTATGTHTGDFQGFKPTNKTIEWQGRSVATIKDGKILSVQTLEDQSAKLLKLGLLAQPSIAGNWTTTLIGIAIRMTLNQSGNNVTGTGSALGQSFPVTGTNQAPMAPNITLQSQLGPGPSNLLTFHGNFEGDSQVQGNYTLGTSSGQATLTKS